MARVDPDTIHLLGGWWSNTIIRYLHTMANSFTKGLSTNMFEHGAYALTLSNQSSNYFHTALKSPQGPFYKGFLEAWYRISVVLVT